MQLEQEASEQNLDHVLSHPFFAKKSSLQQEDSHDREHEGSSTMSDYEPEVKGAGKPVDKVKYKKKPKENSAASVDQQKNAQGAYDIDEKELKEGIKHDRWMRSHGKKAPAKEVGTWVFTTVQGPGKDPDFNDKSKVYMASRPMKLAQAGKEAMKALKSKEVYVMEKLTPEQTEIIEACMCQDETPRVDGRTKAYRETYNRIMNRIKQMEERKKKSCGESWEQA